MKSRLTKLVLTILGGAFLCIGLVSCKNFLNAGKTKAEIEEAIEIANSKPVTIYITTDEGSGSVIPEFITRKKKEVFDLKFTPKQNYKFLNWEVIDITSGQVVSDAVKFEDPLKVETKAYLLKPDSKYQIHAKCVLLPAVVSVSPANLLSSPVNSQIYITFNMAMEEPDIKPSESIFNYGDDNVSIYCGGDNMQRFFDTPSFLDSEKKVLVITPKANELRDWIINEIKMAYIDVTVSFGKNICIQKDDFSLSLAEEAENSVTVRYTSQKEETPPEEYDFFVTRHKINLENAQALKQTPEELFNYANLYQTSGNDEENAKMLQNRTNGTIYIYGKYYDKDSGVRSVTVKEKLVNSKEADISVIADEISHIYLFGNPGVEFLRDTGGMTYFCIECQLQSGDGAVQVKVEVSDVAGNAAEEKAFVAVKKSSLEAEFCISNAGLFNSVYYGMGTNFNEADYLQALRTFSVSANSGFGDIYPVRGIGADFFRNYEFTCQYSDENGNLKTQKLIFSSDGYGFGWSFVLDNPKVSGLEITITEKDDLGNSVQKTYKLPKSDDAIIYKTQYDENREIVKLVSSAPGYTIGTPLAIQTQTNGNRSVFLTSDIYLLNTSQDYYQIVPCFEKRDDCSFFVEIPENLIITYGMEDSSLPEVELKGDASNPLIYFDTTDEKFQGEYATKVTFIIADDSWKNDKYDLIRITWQPYYEAMFEKGKTTCTVLMKTQTLFEGMPPAIVYGYKNGKSTSGKEYPIPSIMDDSLDNIPPIALDQSFFRILNYGTAQEETIYNIHRIDWQTFRISVIDDESGPGFGKVKINGVKDEFTTDDSGTYIFDIPIRNIKPYVWTDGTGHDHWEYNFYFDYWLYDNNNTCRYEKDYKVNIGWLPKVKSISISNDKTKWTYESEVYNNSMQDSVVYGSTVLEKLEKNSEGQYSWNKQIIVGKRDEETTQDGEYYYKRTFSNNDGSGGYKLTEGSYIRISILSDWYCSLPSYFYIGDPSYERGDVIQSHTNKSVLLSSTQPVYVHTVVTNEPYSECVNWTAEEWEYYHEYIGEDFMDFKTYPTPYQQYDIPVRQIDSGSCYAVVAHFASGKTAVSQVFSKED